MVNWFFRLHTRFPRVPNLSPFHPLNNPGTFDPVVNDAQNCDAKPHSDGEKGLSENKNTERQ